MSKKVRCCFVCNLQKKSPFFLKSPGVLRASENKPALGLAHTKTSVYITLLSCVVKIYYRDQRELLRTAAISNRVWCVPSLATMDVDFRESRGRFATLGAKTPYGFLYKINIQWGFCRRGQPSCVNLPP